MRQILLSLAIGWAFCTTTKALIDADAARASRLKEELLLLSEKGEYDWSQIWFTGEPTKLTNERIHGGVE